MRIFDSHFHIIDFEFPIIENQGYIPPRYVVQDYQKETDSLNVLGGAIVSGSFQGFDQKYLLKALKQMGPAFCGVTQLPFAVTDDEIVDLHNNGVRDAGVEGVLLEINFQVKPFMKLDRRIRLLFRYTKKELRTLINKGLKLFFSLPLGKSIQIRDYPEFCVKNLR